MEYNFDMDTSNYMENRLREAIIKEVESYIGFVYSDDTHMNDKLIIKKFDESVSHGNVFYNDYKDEYDYFSMSDLIKGSGTFTFVPDLAGIEVVVNHYYPNARIEAFVKGASKAIMDFINSHGYSREAEFSFMFNRVEFYTYCPSEMETIEYSADDDDDGEYEFVDWERRAMRYYVQNTKSKGFVIQENRLEKLAAEMILTYEDFYKNI